MARPALATESATWAMASIATLDVVSFCEFAAVVFVQTLLCLLIALTCYGLTENDRVGADTLCGDGNWYNNCGDRPVGFEWRDPLRPGWSIRRGTIAFQTGYVCPHGTLLGTLNRRANITYNIDAAHCTCNAPPDSPTLVTLPGLYFVAGAVNEFLSTAPNLPYFCLGFSNLQSGFAAGSWAEVCVFVGEQLVCLRECISVSLMLIIITVSVDNVRTRGGAE
jgi:hypothetical protein